MRVRGWPIIVVAGVAVLAIAVMFRDEIWKLTGRDPGGRSVFAFAGTPSAAERTRGELLVRRLLVDLPVTVRIDDDDHLVVHAERTRDLMEVDMRLGRALRMANAINLRILDYDPDVLKEVRVELRGNKRAVELGFEVKIDSFGYHFEAPHDGAYVNPAWAEKHGCTTRNRLTGTGVYCIITGKDRIEAFVLGDPDLFVEPMRAQVRAEDELIVNDNGKLGRAYVVERAPIVIEPRAVVSAEADGDHLVITLGRAGIAALAARASAPTIELVFFTADGAPQEVRRLPGDKLSIAMMHADAQQYVDSLERSTMPQLRQLPDSP